jgi:hypothetical protein
VPGFGGVCTEGDFSRILGGGAFRGYFEDRDFKGVGILGIGVFRPFRGYLL